MTRLQAYVILFALACLTATFGVLPLLVSSVTDIRYRDLLNAAREPLLMVIATGKLFVVLPEISDKCERLLKQNDNSLSQVGECRGAVVVPLAYPFPHLGKILAFVFISFAAWYVGRGLTIGQTCAMAAWEPYPALPAHGHDAVPARPVSTAPGPDGVVHFAGIPHEPTGGRGGSDASNGTHHDRCEDARGAIAHAVASIWQPRPGVCSSVSGSRAEPAVGTWRQQRCTYELDKQFLSLEVPTPYEDVVVYRARDEVPTGHGAKASVVERVKTDKTLRVGYHPDQFPYCFFNQAGHLVGLDVELMHRLATRLQVRLEFIPFTADTVVEQLDKGEIDVAVGGLIILAGTLAAPPLRSRMKRRHWPVVLRDYQRERM